MNIDGQQGLYSLEQLRQAQQARQQQYQPQTQQYQPQQYQPQTQQYQPQQYQPQTQQYQPQQYQPQTQQYQPPQQAGNLIVEQLTDLNQLDRYRNNGRVEIVIEDRARGYFVLSGDVLNISAIDQQTGGIGVGQELAIFDTNHDGNIVEQELKGAAPITEVPKEGFGETVASASIGTAIVGGLGMGVTGLGAKLGTWAGSKIGGTVGSKVAGLKGWVIGAALGAGIGAIAGVIKHSSDSSKKTDSQSLPVNGYRPETQWNSNRFVKGMY